MASSKWPLTWTTSTCLGELPVNRESSERRLQRFWNKLDYLFEPGVRLVLLTCWRKSLNNKININLRILSASKQLYWARWDPLETRHGCHTLNVNSSSVKWNKCIRYTLLCRHVDNQILVWRNRKITEKKSAKKQSMCHTRGPKIK